MLFFVAINKLHNIIWVISGKSEASHHGYTGREIILFYFRTIKDDEVKLKKSEVDTGYIKNYTMLTSLINIVLLF